MSCDRQTRALLDLLRVDRDAKLDAILAQARASVQSVRSAAFGQAHEQVRRAFEEERRRHDAKCAAATARLATRRRAWEQRRSLAQLDLAWSRIRDAMLQQWRDPPHRARWIAKVATEAQPALSDAGLSIVHGADFMADDRAALFAALPAAYATCAQFELDPGVAAGVKLRSGGTVVDGTLDGLLADRVEIGARLLHRVYRR